MRKKEITRIVCIALAALFLVSGATFTVGAADSVTDKTIKDYADILATISYEEYVSKYFAEEVSPATVTVPFDAKNSWSFEDDQGNTIAIVADQWTLTKKDGTVYTSVEQAVEAGFNKKNLVYIDSYDGKEALYTPDAGAVTWKIDLSAYGITSAALYNIELEYYPVIGKSASVEREFYINGEAPFSEARSLTFAKIWGSVSKDGTAGTAVTYRLGKKESLEVITAEADAAGMKYTSGTDEKTSLPYLVFYQPDVITAKNNAFTDKYGLRFFNTDADNNELRPTLEQLPEWTSYAFYDSDGFYANPFGFVLTPDASGCISLTLDGVNEAMAISSITLKPYTEMNGYADYLATIKNKVGNLNEGTGSVKIEGEYPSNTSTNVVYPIEDRTSALTSPVDPKRTVLNTIGTEKWETAGQWVEYRFSVDASGMYDIYARFMQSYLDGMYVSRSLSVFTDYKDEEAYAAAHGGNSAGYYNGIPFEELSRLRFNYGTGWQVTALSDGADADGDGKPDTYQLYFEKDVVYTLRYEVTLGSMSEWIQKIESILTSLNNDYLSIIKLTGTSPDDYRDYSFSRLLPDTLIDMILQGEELTKISNFLKESAGVASTYSGICDKLATLLHKLGIDENAIAKNLDTMKSYVGSLGTFLTDAKTQPLQFDYISVQPASAKAPKATANFFQSFGHEFVCFVMSFFRDYNSMGAMEETSASESINVWLAYGRDQAQVIRSLCTNDFTPDSGIAVDLKLVAGGTLLPSILAGMGPDVYIGLAQADVINYAIRGALINVEEHEGFDVITREFNEAAMMVLGMSDADGDMHYYGLPVTQGFSMMFIRTDILSDLKIEIPKTWEDIYIAQSELESNNMEIGVNTDYKIFLYQMGGGLFADNGMRINLDSIVGLEAFEKMCNMFTQYSFPYSYDAANRFRTGEMPIIISDYTSLYNKLKVFATELDGCWTFVPLPGITQEDGTINNCSISSASAEVMIEGIKKEDAAWEFMKWYAGDTCQTEYANEMVAIIGDSAKHSTANRTALESMPWTHDEYTEVSKQFENLASVPNYPGYYYIDRYTHFAFLSAYNDDADPSTELLSYINIINKEITRKREEFKLETLEIGQTLAAKRKDQIGKALALLEENFGADGNEKYTAAITAAKYAVANNKITQLQEAAEMFEAILAGDWDGTKITVTKVSGKTIEEPSYYVNVSKQTAEKKNGGYSIDSLKEQQLVYFISVCLHNTADALASY